MRGAKTLSSISISCVSSPEVARAGVDESRSTTRSRPEAARRHPRIAGEASTGARAGPWSGTVEGPWPPNACPRSTRRSCTWSGPRCTCTSRAFRCSTRRRGRTAGCGSRTSSRVIASRLHLAPRLRQRVKMVPFDLALPVWVDDPSFDLGFHVRRAALPSPGGRRELVRAGPADPLAPARPDEAALGALRDRGARGRPRGHAAEGPPRDDRRAVRHAPRGGDLRPRRRTRGGSAASGLGTRSRNPRPQELLRQATETVFAHPIAGGDDRGRGRPAFAGARRARAGSVLGGLRSIFDMGVAAHLTVRRADRPEPPVRDHRGAPPAVQGHQGCARRNGERRRAHGDRRRALPRAARARRSRRRDGPSG